MKNKIAIFLDVDGVLNQYDNHERIRRYKIYIKNNHSQNKDIFNPFQKKVLRLFKLVKKYKIDVYVFSAWYEEKLQPHLPFKLKGDTSKWISNMNEISENYKYSIVIDDEIETINKKGCKGEIIDINKNIIQYQPDGDFGLIKKDFIKLEQILNKFNI